LEEFSSAGKRIVDGLNSRKFRLLCVKDHRRGKATVPDGCEFDATIAAPTDERAGMTSTYNLRAVRAVRRVESMRRSAWGWVPPIAWLLLVNSLLLTVAALACLTQMNPKSRGFLTQAHGLDVIVGLAALLAGAALIASVHAVLRRLIVKHQIVESWRRLWPSLSFDWPLKSGAHARR
jgi:hypothetical protein